MSGAARVTIRKNGVQATVVRLGLMLLSLSLLILALCAFAAAVRRTDIIEIDERD